MALFKRRGDEFSIPDGLMEASVALVKGMAVGRKLNESTKKYEIVLPTADTGVYGFVTLREDEAVYARSHYDEIPAGKKAVVYTLVKNQEWATDQFTGSFEIGDQVAAGPDGKLVKYASDNGVLIGEVVDMSDAMAGYENPLIVVKIL